MFYGVPYMTGQQLQEARKSKGWSQEQAALRLGVSQPYLSLLENGGRDLPEELVRKAMQVYKLSAAMLPLRLTMNAVPPANENALAAELASLGYSGLAYMKSRPRRNPAEVLLSALSVNDLDSRLVEALPWVLVKFPELNWRWLINAAKVNDLQNRLGFVTNVARRLAGILSEHDTAALLIQQESALERSRLMREDTLCHDSLTNAERLWLREHRSEEAKHWRLLTDLSPEHLTHVT
jgi:transcriptional regulator with XRE-family HTH domain